MKHHLFRIPVRVLPTVQHPKFFDVADGFLVVWLYAEDKAQAIERTRVIVECMPYEIVLIDEDPEFADDCVERRPECQIAAENARHIGLSVALISTPPGSESLLPTFAPPSAA